MRRTKAAEATAAAAKRVEATVAAKRVEVAERVEEEMAVVAGTVVDRRSNLGTCNERSCLLGY